MKLRLTIALSIFLSAAADLGASVLLFTGTDTGITRFDEFGGASTFATGYAPSALAVNPSNYTVLAADPGSGTVYLYTLGGAQSIFATGFFTPSGLAVDSSGNVYVADASFNQVVKLGPDGGFLDAYPTGSNPTFLTLDPSGNLFVSDYFGGEIESIDTVLGFPTPFAFGLDFPSGIAVNAAGEVFAATQGDGFVRRFDTDGNPTDFASGLTTPSGLALDPDGNVYVADTDAGMIYRYTSGGSRSDFASGLSFPSPIAVMVTPEPGPFVLVGLALLGLVWRRRTVTAASGIVLAVALCGGQLHAQSTDRLYGFCRERTSLNVLPFELKTYERDGGGAITAWSGQMTAHPEWSVGADRAGHYSATGTGTQMIVGFQPAAGATPEKLVTVEATTGAKAFSTAGLANTFFTGNSMALQPSSSPATVWGAQAAGQATSLFSIDVAAGTLGKQITIPWSVPATVPRRSLPRAFSNANSGFSQMAYVLHPCFAGYAQVVSSVPTDVDPWAYTQTSFDTDYCLDAPGWHVGNRLIAIGKQDGGDGLQLVRLTLATGAVTPVGFAGPTTGFVRGPASPYFHYFGQRHLYALNTNQSAVVVWTITTGAFTIYPLTIPSPCAQGSITAFATAATF